MGLSEVAVFLDKESASGRKYSTFRIELGTVG